MSRDHEQPPSTLPGEETPGPIPIAIGSELANLRGQVGRLVAPGFEPPPRLVIAVEPERIAALASSLLLIEEIRPVLKAGCPRAPRLLGILWLGESCAVEVVGIPADETFSPTWPLVLGGASVVVDACASEQAALRVSCEAVELTHMPAERLLGAPLDVTSPPDIARLMRAALASVTQFSE
ncbi:MAG TPA: hypothetical protein VK459_15835 [Polyangiaceae bacterium]|nr:hypothetical protein [Polyangiaceae bacterium]